MMLPLVLCCTLGLASRPSLAPYAPIFHTPSLKHSDNMPLGNGELTANIWVNGSDGSISLLLGRSDAWSSVVQPLKVGRVKILMEPSPFLPTRPRGKYTLQKGYIGDQHHPLLGKECRSAASCPAESALQCDEMPGCVSYALNPAWHNGTLPELFTTGLSAATANQAWNYWYKTMPAVGDFAQTLDVEKGLVTITANNSGLTVSVAVWIDSERNVVHTEVNTSSPVKTSVELDLWRYNGTRTSKDTGARGTCGDTQNMFADTVVPSSSLHAGEEAAWYHRNTESMYKQTMRDQSLGALANSSTDPLMQLTTGGLVMVLPPSTISTSNMESANIGSAATTATTTGLSAVVSIYTLTSQPAHADDWLSHIRAYAAADSTTPSAQTISASKVRTSQWWRSFYNRSWLIITNSSQQSNKESIGAHTEEHTEAVHPSSSPAPQLTSQITQGYILARFLSALQSRGRFPIHHNGGTIIHTTTIHTAIIHTTPFTLPLSTPHRSHHYHLHNRHRDHHMGGA
jgi:hypothetical protein